MTTQIKGREVRVYWNSQRKRASVVEVGTNKTLAKDTLVVIDQAVLMPRTAQRRRPYVTGYLADLGEDARDSIPLRVPSVPISAPDVFTSERAYIHNGKVVLAGSID